MTHHLSSVHGPQLVDQQVFNNGLQPTETNMMVEFFANTDKLIETDKRVYYEKDHHATADADNNYDDDLDDDVDKYSKPTVFQKAKDPPKQASAHENERNTSDAKHVKSKHETTTHEEVENNASAADGEDISKWTTEKLRCQKLVMMRKLGELMQRGIVLSQNYGLHSDYNDMKFEYELHSGIQNKKNAVEWMSGAMYSIIKGLEMLNDNYNPFDIKFEGVWSNGVGSNIANYYEVLGELYEKYTSSGQPMAPEFKLFLMLTGSAINIQMHKGVMNLLPSAAKTLDEDPGAINELRQKAELKAEKLNEVSQPVFSISPEQKQKIDEKVMKDHNEASAIAADNKWIKQSELTYDHMRRKSQNNSEMEHFKNNLMMSESAKSLDTKKDKVSKMSKQVTEQLQQEALMMQQLENQKRKQDLAIQQQKLLDVNKMLDSFSEDNKKNKQKKQTKTKTTDSSNVSSLSSSSTVSVISVNPKKDQILGYKKNSIKVDKVVDTPEPSRSSKKHIDSKGSDNVKKMLDRITSDMSETKKKKDLSHITADISYDAISVGTKSKRSRDSDESSNGKADSKHKKGYGISFGK
jgi:hypothetical protein